MILSGVRKVMILPTGRSDVKMSRAGEVITMPRVEKVTIVRSGREKRSDGITDWKKLFQCRK